MQLNISASDIQLAFDKAGIGVGRNGIVDKCKSLCIQYGLPVSEFVAELEAFKINKGIDVVEMSHLGKIEEALRKKATTAANHGSAASQSKLKRASDASTPLPTKRLAVLGSYGSPAYAASSPDAGSPDSQYSQTNTGGSKYSSRPNQNQIVLTFNKFIKDRESFVPSTLRPLGTRVRLSVDIPEDFDNALQRYRYMFCSLGERAAAIDKHLMAVQSDMMNWKAISELQPVRIPHQDVVWTCGRVRCETTEGKLNKTSVMIEGSRADSSGRTTLLDLSELGSFALFPGQTVLVQGTDAIGGRMVVRGLVEGVPRPLPCTAPSRLLDYHHSPLYQGGKPVTMFCAAGPFTPADDLRYQPLQDLLLKVIAEKPDVLVLLGPFVDINQPLLAGNESWIEDAGGRSLCSYELIFMQKVVRDCFQAYFNGEDAANVLPTQIILVPSLSDGHHDFVYPQPPFGNRGVVKSELFEEELGNVRFPFEDNKDNKKRINLMPNPCMFRLNETLIGATSTDVLFALSADECSLNCENRMSRLAGHILEQQSFYPMFPAPDKHHPQLDMRQSKHWQMKRSPDILFVPSKLSCLATEIHGSLVVNPGLLVKGFTGGTYARLVIDPIPEAELRNQQSANPDSPIPHSIHSRTRVDIVKI